VLRREHGHHAGLLIDGIQHTVGAWNVDGAQSLLRALLFRAVTDLLHRPTRSRASSPAPTGQRWNLRCASRKTDVALPHDLRIDERARSGRRRHGQRGRRKPKKSSHDDCVTDDRQRLARTFDSAAELYQQGRPEYPEPLYDTLVEVAGIGAGDRLLEVGCATGKATLPLARRGFRFTCVEIGPDLVAVTRRNLAAFPNVEVMGGAFETWQPPLGDRFDLVFAATAWHWIDPELRYQRAWESLRPGGHLAFWSATHVIPEGGDPFFVEIQDVYEEIGEGMPANATLLRPGGIPDSRAEIDRSGLFEDVVIRHFDWEISYKGVST